MADELVIVQAPENVTSLTIPDGVVPKLVMVAVPVTVTASPSEAPRSVVDAEAMVADEFALVDRMMAESALMKSSRLLPMASDPAGLLLAGSV